MKKLNITLIATICFIVIAVLIAGVFSYHLMTTTRAANTPTITDYQTPGLKGTAGKPDSSLNTAAGNVAPPTPTPETFVGSLQTQVNSTIDDGGQSDLDAIKSAASKL